MFHSTNATPPHTISLLLQNGPQKRLNCLVGCSDTHWSAVSALSQTIDSCVHDVLSLPAALLVAEELNHWVALLALSFAVPGATGAVHGWSQSFCLESFAFLPSCRELGAPHSFPITAHVQDKLYKPWHKRMPVFVASSS